MSYFEQERALPELYNGYNVVVAGGGIAGIAAALAAAREGSSVLLIERMFALGGLATLGLIAIYLPLCDGMGHQVSFGITEELLRLSISKGYDTFRPHTWLEGSNNHGKQRFECQYNPNVFSILCEQLLTDAGVDILFGTVACGVFKKENRINAIAVENKDGRSAVPADMFIDTTGDADIFSLSGEKTSLYQPGNSMASWYYETINGKTSLQQLGASDVKRDDETLSLAKAFERKRITGLNSYENSKCMIDGRRVILEKFLKNGEVSEIHSLSSLSGIPQLRMTRRMIGVKTLAEEDVFRSFEDSVGLIGDWRKRGPIYEVPLGTLWNGKTENLLTAGRTVSVTDGMWDITRVIPAAALTGQAAGTAASMCRSLNSLNIVELQNKLRQSGMKIHSSEINK